MAQIAQAKTTMNDLRKAMHKTRGDALMRKMYKTVAHAKSKHGTCLTKRRTERKQKTAPTADVGRCANKRRAQVQRNAKKDYAAKHCIKE